MRFTTKGDVLYAIVMGAPAGPVSIKSLGTDAKLLGHAIGGITLLGSDETLTWSQSAGAVVIEMPKKPPSDIASVFKITSAPDDPVAFNPWRETCSSAETSGCRPPVRS